MHPSAPKFAIRHSHAAITEGQIDVRAESIGGDARNPHVVPHWVRGPALRHPADWTVRAEYCDRICALVASLRGRLARAFAPKYNLNRLEQYVDVQEDAVVLEIVQVVLQLLARVVD